MSLRHVVGLPDGQSMRFDKNDTELEGSETPRTRPLGRRAADDGGAAGKEKQSGSNRLFSATSAAFTRVKGTLRPGGGGNPGSATLVSSLFSPSRERSRGSGGGLQEAKTEGSELRIDGSGSSDGGNTSNKQKLSVIFDDDGSDDAENVSEEDSSSDKDAVTPRSQWASTLVASTKARGNATVRGRVDLLPRPRDSDNKVKSLWWNDAWGTRVTVVLRAQHTYPTL